MSKKSKKIGIAGLLAIRNADVIFVLKDGRLVEHGGHQQLMTNGGLYSELYKTQFG